MPPAGTKRLWTVVGVALLLASALLTGPLSQVVGEEGGAEVKPVRVEQLPNVPGMTLTAMVVTYAPAGKSCSHQHGEGAQPVNP